jgi:hypothetical protein
MTGYRTPSHGEFATPSFQTPHAAYLGVQFTTPISLRRESPRLTTPVQEARTPTVHTQTDVNAKPKVKRLQQDLLVLTSFKDNSTLHWRPIWFSQEAFANRT